MSKTTIKFLLWILVITIFGGGFLGAIYGIGSLITYFNTGADPAAALNIHPNVPLDWPVGVEWLPDDVDTGREMEPFTRENIEAAYIRAWLQQGFSYTKGEPHGLKTYFTGPALAMVEDNVNHVAAQELQVAQVASSHFLQLHYYSADGTIVAFTDREARVAQHIKDADGNEVMAEEDLAAYQVVMMVDEGNWKVRHWLRRDIEEFGTDRPVDPAMQPPSDEIVRLEDGQLILGDEPYKIRGFNYYPQENSWTDMWENYEGDTISQDLKKMADMGMNTVRIFVPYELFGIDEVIDEAPDYTQRLRDFLNEAYRYDLRVVVTLYDFKSDYNVLTWPKADRHMEQLMTTFNRHPAILAWDLKNEPDLDYDAAGEELVNIWLKHILDQARIYDPYHLITIGWAKAEHADELAAELDFVSFHYYAPTSQFLETLTALQIKVGPEKPVMLGEFGLPTWNPRLFPGGHSEADQYNYYREILLHLQDGATAGYLAWTIYDFPHVPAQVAGRLPWKRYPQREMGIIRTDGTAKPAAVLFQPEVSQELLETPIENSGIKPFYQTAFAGLVLTMLVLIILIWRVWLRIVDRFGEEADVAQEEGETSPQPITTIEQPKRKRTILRRAWRAWRARRLIKRRRRRDRKYGRWERRAARRKRRRARRWAMWRKLTNIWRILRGKPIHVDGQIQESLRQSNSGTDDEINEMKPLIEIPDGVKELHEKIQQDDEPALQQDDPELEQSGESVAQARIIEESQPLSRQEMVSRLLQPRQGAAPPLKGKRVDQKESADDEARQSKPNTITVPNAKPPKQPEQPDLSIDEEKLANFKPNTTDIFYIGKPNRPASDSKVRLEYDQAAPSPELKEVKDTPTQQPPAAFETIFEDVSYQDGYPVIRFDLGKAAEEAFQIPPKNAAETPEPKPILDDAEKPGDGFSLDTSGIPAEENEFALDENILWSDLEPAEPAPDPLKTSEEADSEAVEEAGAGESDQAEDEADDSDHPTDQVPADMQTEKRYDIDDLDRFFTWEE